MAAAAKASDETGYEGYEALRISVAGGVARATVDHPPINLIDRTLYRELDRFTREVAADAGVRVVVLDSADPEFFLAHFDVSLILRAAPGRPRPGEPTGFQAVVERLRTMPKATIAVVAGRAGGGGSELALSCDMRFAARGRAVFNQPEVALGILPGGSGTQRLHALVGRGRALEAVLGCADVDAELAEHWGWVNRALPPEELGPFVDRLAQRIASFPPEAVAAAKEAVDAAAPQTVAGLLAEASAFDRTLAYGGAQERMRRFLDAGGQTREVELALADAIGRLGG